MGSFIMDLKVLIIICLFGLCCGAGAPGAPWTAEETEIIYKKLRTLFKADMKNSLRQQMIQLGVDYQDYTENTNFPSAAKVLRLAFHDCVPYTAAGGAVNGCDGCLNPKGMGTDFLKRGTTEQTHMGDKTCPDVTHTDHNGLLFTADMLELVYTNPKFPKMGKGNKGWENTAVLKVSMKDSGKSRADLWHFAALVAIHYGANNNNLACNFKSPDTCGHYRYWADDCEMSLKALNSFKTGRKDCKPNHPGIQTDHGGDKIWKRDFFTKRKEIHPNLHGNGLETTKYFKDNFGLTAREGIALLEGAHSFGQFHREVSMHKYAWNRMQTRLLNNQQFRNIANEPMFKAVCKKNHPLILLGNAKGEPSNIEWQLTARRVTKNGGPFQWWKRYDMCDSRVSFLAQNEMKDIKGNHDVWQDVYDRCVKGYTGKNQINEHYGGIKCNPDCEKNQIVMETSLGADVGLYFHFESDPKTGQPYGCDGYTDDVNDWEDMDDGFMTGAKRVYPNQCKEETHAPEGEPLYKIVLDYAGDQQKWFDDFIPIIHKMSANGYKDSDLKTYDFDFESMLKYVPACKNKFTNKYPC